MKLLLMISFLKTFFKLEQGGGERSGFRYLQSNKLQYFIIIIIIVVVFLNHLNLPLVDLILVLIRHFAPGYVWP